jgi:hypothetical protein
VARSVVGIRGLKIGAGDGDHHAHSGQDAVRVPCSDGHLGEEAAKSGIASDYAGGEDPPQGSGESRTSGQTSHIMGRFLQRSIGVSRAFIVVTGAEGVDRRTRAE